MCLCVEDPLVQREDAVVVGEQEEQVLESLPKEEALHLVLHAGVAPVLDVLDGGVAASVDPRVFLESAENLPSPVAILLLFRQPVHDEQGLHSLGS